MLTLIVNIPCWPLLMYLILLAVLMAFYLLLVRVNPPEEVTPMAWPRKQRVHWCDADYAKALEHMRADLEKYRQRFGTVADTERLFARELGELEDERRALARREARASSASSSSDAP